MFAWNHTTSCVMPHGQHFACAKQCAQHTSSHDSAGCPIIIIIIIIIIIMIHHHHHHGLRQRWSISQCARGYPMLVMLGWWSPHAGHFKLVSYSMIALLQVFNDHDVCKLLIYYPPGWFSASGPPSGNPPKNINVKHAFTTLKNQHKVPQRSPKDTTMRSKALPGTQNSWISGKVKSL